MSKSRRILAVDIGGTKVAAAVFEETGPETMQLTATERYGSREHEGLGEILNDFLTKLGGTMPRALGIGVAGPVVGRRAQLTNLPWAIDADELQERLGVPVLLVNDLEAHAHGIPHVAPDKRVVLNAGSPRAGNAALIAAGTGLGEAILFWDGKRFQPSASEGGHTSFAPARDEDVELLAFLRKRYEHVSWERVVSGLDGFRNIYDFLVETKRIDVPKVFQTRVANVHDIGTAVTEAWRDGEPFAAAVVERFVRLYGAEAGNLALKALATSGVYVSGGIVGHLVPLMKQGWFMEAFVAKGRFRQLLERVPVTVLLDEQIGLKGAAAVAMHAAPY